MSDDIYKIYLDDADPSLDGWEWVRSVDEAIQRLETGEVSEISVSHNPVGPPGKQDSSYLVLTWIAVAVEEGLEPPTIHDHTEGDPMGRALLAQGIKAIKERRQRYLDYVYGGVP